MIQAGLYPGDSQELRRFFQGLVREAPPGCFFHLLEEVRGFSGDYLLCPLGTALPQGAVRGIYFTQQAEGPGIFLFQKREGLIREVLKALGPGASGDGARASSPVCLGILPNASPSMAFPLLLGKAARELGRHPLILSLQLYADPPLPGNLLRALCYREEWSALPEDLLAREGVVLGGGCSIRDLMGLEEGDLMGLQGALPGLGRDFLLLDAPAFLFAALPYLSRLPSLWVARGRESREERICREELGLPEPVLRSPDMEEGGEVSWWKRELKERFS